MTPEEKLAAKQTNESVRLSAALTNNLALGLFVGGIVAPSAAGRSIGVVSFFGLSLCAAALHIAGKGLLRLMKSED